MGAILAHTIFPTTRTSVLIVAALVLGGCMSAVPLRHPTTGEAAQCGPYWLKWGVGYFEMERCLNDYYRQGYVRVKN